MAVTKRHEDLNGNQTLQLDNGIVKVITSDMLIAAQTAFNDGNDFTSDPAVALAWAPTKIYSLNQRALSPEGKLIVCRVAHTSLSTYDARNWIYIGEENSVLIDFTQLPNGVANTIKPTKGCVPYFGVPEARWGEYGITNGRFTEVSPGSSTTVTYLQAMLPDSREKVQHIWADFEVAAAPALNESVVLLSTSDDWSAIGSEFRAGIHWLFLANVAGGTGGRWDIGPYNAPGVTSGPTFTPSVSPWNRRIRLDITVDRATGQMCGYVNGVLAVSYTSLTVLNFISHRAVLEINGPTFKIRQFGASAHMPNITTDGTGRNTVIKNNDYSAVSTLSASWQLIHEFKVTYDEGGCVDVMWNPYITASSAAVVEMDLSTAVLAPSGFYSIRMADSPTSCRVPFISRRFGTPGTTESIGIWAKSNGAGSAVIQGTTYGDRIGGPRWSPANYRLVLGV